jgi:hypothetical protein
MEERALRSMIAEVKTGRMSRRHFVQAMVGLGLTAPMAAQMLAAAGVAQAQPKVAYKPTKRGGGGPLKTLWWQGATLLNPHFAVGTKDQDGSRIFYEPLASWDPDGNLAPVLAVPVTNAESSLDRYKAAAAISSGFAMRPIAWVDAMSLKEYPDPEKAYRNCRAGADIIVIGNAIEKDLSLIKEMSDAIHSVPVNT